MRHNTHRFFAQVQWLAVGPLVVSGGFALHGFSEWAMFLLGLLITSAATHAIRWASTQETTLAPGARIYRTIQALTPRWQFGERLLVLVAGWIVTALGGITGAARALAYRLVGHLLHGHRPLMASAVAVLFSGTSVAAITMGGSWCWAATTGHTPPSSLPWVLGAAVALGWWGSIFCDLLTETGASLLYPFSRRRVSLLALRTSPAKWQRGPDGNIPKRPTPTAFGEAMFNGLLALSAIWIAVTILAVA